MIACFLGATEIARPDIARPSKLWRLTSQNWSTWHHTERWTSRDLTTAPDIKVFQKKKTKKVQQLLSQFASA